jgi:hypothetical protein
VERESTGMKYVATNCEGSQSPPRAVQLRRKKKKTEEEDKKKKIKKVVSKSIVTFRATHNVMYIPRVLVLLKMQSVSLVKYKLSFFLMYAHEAN